MIVEDRPDVASGAGPVPPLLAADGIGKTYGATVAVSQMSLAIARREVVGLVGANGAGKSTLMRLLSGATRADSGRFSLGNTGLAPASYGAGVARRFGVRVVYQELSLCTNLTVYENFMVEQPRRFSGPGWREAAREAARLTLDAVFPGSGIDPSWQVEDLTIAQRQMVEIARAASDPDLTLLILDEPTSSLGAEAVEGLLRHVDSSRARGISFIFISHRLKEVLRLCDRIVVMRNGHLIWEGRAAETDEGALIARMGGTALATLERERASLGDAAVGPVRVRVTGHAGAGLRVDTMSLRSGEIVGLAGLEGSGQRQLLRAIYRAARRPTHGIVCQGRTAFVTGDRAKEGIFRLWSVARNMALTRETRGGIFHPVGGRGEWTRTGAWFARLAVAGPHVGVPIVSLSGGNQQKVLIARALLADAEIILLDDPTRGVDVATKAQLYALFREVALQGRLVIWYSTEDEEFAECDRVFVLRAGHIAAELGAAEATKDRLVEASFAHVEGASGERTQAEAAARLSRRRARVRLARSAVPLVTLVAILVAIGTVNHPALSGLGLNLLIGTAVPLVFAALAQMFVIAGSDIDLGIGQFIGLINVLSATVLVDHPPLALLLFAACVVAYGLMGALIHQRRMPAIVVTLGASFIWSGIALTLQDQPGGVAPDWLTNLYNLPVPVVPEPILLCLAGGLLGLLILRGLRYGTVLRGLGNNPLSVGRSGWSPLVARVVLYALAGLFGILGGLAVTAVTTSADATATGSYTLLSIAAVVMGGGELAGGVVASLGVMFGAVTLSLLGALLGFLSVGSNYQPAVQGGLLIAVLVVRSLVQARAQP